MAERRMFSKSIIDSDLFLDMPASTQLLYFHFGMRADDDGFVSQPRSIMRLCFATDDDFRLLVAKGFIIPFESGVIVITHWNVNNSLRKDRQKSTIYEHEKAMLETRNNGIYALSTNCQPSDNQMSTNFQPNDNQLPAKCPHSIVEYSIDKVSIGESNASPPSGEAAPTPEKKKPVFHLFGEYKHVKLTEEQHKKLIEDYGEQKTTEYIRRCDEYVQQTGKTYKDYNLTIRNWIAKDGGKSNTNNHSQSASDDEPQLFELLAADNLQKGG